MKQKWLFLSAAVFLINMSYAKNILQSLGDSSISGQWNAQKTGQRISLMLNLSPEGENWTYSDNFDLREFQVEEKDGQSELILRKGAGSLILKGDFDNQKWKGTYTFIDSASFTSFLYQEGIKGVSAQERMLIFFTGNDKSYFEFMKLNGFLITTAEQLSQLAWQHITRELISQYAEEFKKAGYKEVPLD